MNVSISANCEDAKETKKLLKELEAFENNYELKVDISIVGHQNFVKFDAQKFIPEDSEHKNS